jgi:hypothetical protein
MRNIRSPVASPARPTGRAPAVRAAAAGTLQPTDPFSALTPAQRAEVERRVREAVQAAGGRAPAANPPAGRLAAPAPQRAAATAAVRPAGQAKPPSRMLQQLTPQQLALVQQRAAELAARRVQSVSLLVAPASAPPGATVRAQAAVVGGQSVQYKFELVAPDGATVSYPCGNAFAGSATCAFPVPLEAAPGSTWRVRVYARDVSNSAEPLAFDQVTEQPFGVLGAGETAPPTTPPAPDPACPVPLAGFQTEVARADWLARYPDCVGKPGVVIPPAQTPAAAPAPAGVATGWYIAGAVVVAAAATGAVLWAVNRNKDGGSSGGDDRDDAAPQARHNPDPPPAKRRKRRRKRG